MKDPFDYICRYVESHYKPIEVNAGNLRYNYKCHLNSVHEAVKAEEKTIAMCVVFDNETFEPFIHFLNITDGEYIDNTLGYWCKGNRHFLVREVKESEFDSIGNIFNGLRDHLLSLVPWYAKIFKKVNV